MQGALFLDNNNALGFLGGANRSETSLSKDFVKSISFSACFLVLALLVVVCDPFSVGLSLEPIIRFHITEHTSRNSRLIY